MLTVGVPQSLGYWRTAYSDSCALGVLLLQEIFHADSRVRDVAFAVVRDVLASDENNSVGAFADSRDASNKASNILRVGFALQFLVLGVHQ
jgi:hypothetical protein